MKESAQSAIGSAIGCVVVGGVALFALLLTGMLALAFPITVSVVVTVIAVLAVLEWRRRVRARRS